MSVVGVHSTIVACAYICNTVHILGVGLVAFSRAYLYMYLAFHLFVCVLSGGQCVGAKDITRKLFSERSDLKC